MSDDLDTGTSETSDVDFLAEGDSAETDTNTDKTEEIPEDETPEDEAPEETPEEDEEEEEEETPEEDEAEITRPSWKEIKEKYPELAKNKDFQNMFHRERAYSEIFPTVEDAKEASKAYETLEYFDNSLIEGDPRVLLNALNEQTVARFAQNILPSLYNTNPALFKQATEPLFIDLLNIVATKAEENRDENLLISAKNMAKFLFGKFEIPTKINRTSPELEQERQKLQQERQSLIQRQEGDFYSRADRSIAKQLRRTIEDGLDPNNEMSEFTRNALIKQVLDDTVATLKNDQTFNSKIQNLHRLAKNAGFPPDYMPRFISTYLGRAKSLALTLRAKHKSAAVVKRTPPPKTRIEGSSKTETKQISTKREGTRKSDMDIILEGS